MLPPVPSYFISQLIFKSSQAHPWSTFESLEVLMLSYYCNSRPSVFLCFLSWLRSLHPTPSHLFPPCRTEGVAGWFKTCLSIKPYNQNKLSKIEWLPKIYFFKMPSLFGILVEVEYLWFSWLMFLEVLFPTFT